MNTQPLLLAPPGSSVLFYQNIMLCPYVGLPLSPCVDIDYGRRLDESELPARVRKYCRDTKMRYIEQSVLPESDWPPTLGGDYIRLALVKQGRTTRDFKYREVVALQKDYVRGKYDKILQDKTEIKLEEIFDPIFCQGGYEITLKMLIDGAPGVGKTTLSRNVTQKWAEGKFLEEYWLVLLLHLRERDISRAQTIDDFFYHDDQMVQDAVATFVKEMSGRGVLLIFDGFDELSLTQRREQSLFLDIIRGKILNKCSVVITSRPYASRPVQELQSVDRHVEVLGFTKEQIYECVKQRISDGAKAEELCAELEDRLDIASICQIPLNCSIVLYVYEMEDYRLPDTLTELYELFILHSLRRYTTRTHSANATERLRDLRKLPSPIQDHFDILSKLAYSSLKEDKLVFEREELEQALSMMFSTDAPMLDLMTSAKSYSGRGTHDTYSFLHLTIQEYLCALWAAKNLSDKDKLDFLRENLQKERFYMTLWFFAGITRLDISNVCSIFSNNLWKYDNHVHICHLLYESDSSNHSHCSYVAENCVSRKEISFVKQDINHQRRYHQRYSRFDLLMIAHFLAHSQCQWNGLTLHLDDVKILHKVFKGLKLCGTSILQVVIKVGKNSIASFHGGIICMLNEIPQFHSIKIFFHLADLSEVLAFRAIQGNVKNVLIRTKAIKSIYVEITDKCKDKDKVTRNFYDELIEGIAYNGSLVQNLTLQIVNVQAIERLISLLIKWNSNLELVNLSISNNSTHYCCEEKQCCEFYRSLSTFLSKNSSLRQVTISPPFDDHYLVRCIDTIQAALDQNSTLEKLNIRKKIIFQRNKHTSKLELVKGHVFLHSCSLADQPEEGDASHSRVSSENSESSCMESDSDDDDDDDDDDDVESFQTSPAKRQKIGNSNKESSCQATLAHLQPELNPRQPQPPIAAFSSSQLPTLTHSPLCQSLYFSQCATVSPQLQPIYCMAGSSSTQGTHHSASRNHQILSQEQNDRQNQSGNIAMTQLPHRLGSTNTLSPMGLKPPTMIPYQQQSHNNMQPELNPRQPQPPMVASQFPTLTHSSLYLRQYATASPQLQPNYHCMAGSSPTQRTHHSVSHTGMNPPLAPARTLMMSPAPTAGHALQNFFTSEPEQFRPATAPLIQTMYNPNTGGAFLTTSADYLSSPLPTTSTST